MNCCRPLIDNQLAKTFVEGIIGLTDPNKISEAVTKIRRAEIQLVSMGKKCTYLSECYRDIRCASDVERVNLRAEIFQELISHKRLINDDDIKKGQGGALPLTELKIEKQAIIISGLPASGKSTIANKIADEWGAIILDSDFAKRKFPEFEEEFGASLVHEESSIVVFGDEDANAEPCVKGYCISEGHNVVIPKIGNDRKSIISLAEYFCSYDYDVHLVLVSLNRQASTKRAFNRFMETNRYVPLSLIFDLYANDPMLAYHRMKNNKSFKSYGKVSTEGSSPKYIESSAGSPSLIFNN
ncbi:MAG: zeta toxin family protein [Bacteroidales bacterium]|nr:zeta toxin family protein [Bacteroidales bacterium]